VAAAPAPRPTKLREAVHFFERQHILDVLAQAQFDKRDAARLLGISLASLYRKVNVTPADGTAPRQQQENRGTHSRPAAPSPVRLSGG
jgi:DNA-binding NtrC family response regulator